MPQRIRHKLVKVATSVLTTLGLVTGVAFATNYCTSEWYSGCGPTGVWIPDYCCIDSDGDGVRHWADCWRRQYICPGGHHVYGAYDYCSNFGSVCS
jgi:hypothetical protein